MQLVAYLETNTWWVRSKLVKKSLSEGFRTKLDEYIRNYWTVHVDAVYTLHYKARLIVTYVFRNWQYMADDVKSSG